MIDKKIYLLDYLVKELRKWKIILIAAIIGGILVASAGYIHAKKSYDDSVAAIEKTYGTNLDEEIKALSDNLDEDSLDNVEKYCDKARNLRSQEEYVNDSIIMKLDGNRVHSVTYVISIEYDGDDESSNKIVDMVGYVISLFQSDDFMKLIGDAFYSESEPSYIPELISIQRSANATNVGEAPSSINLKIIIPNDVESEECDKLIVDYVNSEGKKLNNYMVKVINNSEAYVSDVSIINKQRDTFTTISAYRTSLEADMAKFSGNEQTLAELLIAKELNDDGSRDKKTKQEALAEVSSPGISKKYILMGFFLGIIFVMGIDFVYLIITTRTNTMEEICSYFSIKPLLVFYDKAGKGFLTNSKKIYQWQYKRYSDQDKQFDNFKRQMELLARDNSVKEIQLLTCIGFDDIDNGYVERIKEVGKAMGVDIIEAEAEFIGKIDTSSQLSGDSPIILYIRQNRTLVTRLAEVKAMAEKNRRDIVGFVYVDC